MIKRMTLSDFRDSMNKVTKEFSYQGLEALFEYLEELVGDRTVFDAIGICSDYVEYLSISEALADLNEDSEQDLRYNATVIDIPGGGVIILKGMKMAKIVRLQQDAESRERNRRLHRSDRWMVVFVAACIIAVVIIMFITWNIQP